MLRERKKTLGERKRVVGERSEVNGRFKLPGRLWEQITILYNRGEQKKKKSVSEHTSNRFPNQACPHLIAVDGSAQNM